MSKEKYQPSDKEKHMLDHVMTRFSAMKIARSTRDSEWEDNENAYIASFRSNDQYQSDVNLPIEWSHVQHAMSEVMDSPPQVIFDPKNEKAVDKLEINQSVWDSAWDKADTDAQMFEYYLSAFVHGTAVWYEGYQKTTRKSYKKIGLTEEDLKKMNLPLEYLDEASFAEENVVEYDDVYGECVPVKEFYMDDGAKTFFEPTHSKDAVDCIRHRFFTPSQFYQKFGKYERVKYVSGFTSEWNDAYQNVAEKEDRKTSVDKIDVKEYWNRETQSYIIQVNDEVIINGDGFGEKFVADHGRLPFAVASCFKVPGSPWGLSLVALLRGLRAQANLIFNIGCDQGKNTIQPPLLKGSGMEVLDEEWYAGMGFILNVNGSLDDIKELPVGQLSNQFFSLLDRLEVYEVLATGADVRSLVKSEPTAFQQANKKEISLKRLKSILQFIHWDGLKQMVELRWSNIKQVYTMDNLESITGEDVNGDGKVGKRVVRVKNKQVVNEFDGETGEPLGMKFIPADGFTDFFTLSAEDLSDYDFKIDFKLNTSKELKKLRFQEAINVLPIIVKTIEINLFNPMEMLELWADVYEIPQKVLNKQQSADSEQRPLGAPPPQPPEAAPEQMSPQGGFDPAQGFNDMVQNSFNVAQ